MKASLLALLALFVTAGCGSSSDATGVNSPSFDFRTTDSNFTSTTVQVERRFLYTLNQNDNTVSGYVLAGEEEGEGHVHGRILAQEHEHEHEHSGEEELNFQELDGSPFVFGNEALIDLTVDPDGRFLHLLDATGRVRTFRIDGFRGFLFPESETLTSVTNPRRLIFSGDGSGLAVLGDSVSLHLIGEDGILSVGAVLPNTATWTDVALNGPLAVGATPNGVTSFQWTPGVEPSQLFVLALPGNSRGELRYTEAGIYVVNRQAASLSLVQQESDASVSLIRNFELAAELSDPFLLTTLFDGEDLVVADSDTVALLHPDETELETEGLAPLERVPTRLFEIPELSAFLVGHAAGSHSTLIEVSEDGLTASETEGPGGQGIQGFGFAERVELVTETGSF